MRKLLAVLVAALLAAALTTSAFAGAPPVKKAKVESTWATPFGPGKLTDQEGHQGDLDMGRTWQRYPPRRQGHRRGPAKFQSRLQVQGTFSHLFNQEARTYVLHCTIHTTWWRR